MGRSCRPEKVWGRGISPYSGMISKDGGGDNAASMMQAGALRPQSDCLILPLGTAVMTGSMHRVGWSEGGRHSSGQFRTPNPCGVSTGPKRGGGGGSFPVWGALPGFPISF